MVQLNFYKPERYRRTQEGGSYKPEKAPDIASVMESRFQDYERRNRAYERSLEESFESQRRAQKSEHYNKDQEIKEMEALSEFSSTLYDRLSDAHSEYKKQLDTERTYDSLFDPSYSATPAQRQASEKEDQLVAEGDAQALQTAQTAVDVEEATGKPESAEVYRSRAGGFGQQITSTRGRLLIAQSQYGSWLPQYLSTSQDIIKVGDIEMTVAEAARSGDSRLTNAAAAAARVRFLQDFGLQDAPKSLVVSTLAQQMVASEASTVGAMTRQAITDNRKAETDRINAIGYNLGHSTGNPQQNFTNLSHQFFTASTGMTRAEANEAAVKSLIAGYVAAGRPDAIEALRGVIKVGRYDAQGNFVGQPGTELGGSYGALIDKGIEDAKSQQASRTEAGVKDVKAEMYAQLNGVTGLDARSQIVEQAATRLENLGQFQEARQLRQQQAALSVPGGVQQSEAAYEQAILNGEVTTVRQLDEARSQGLISQTGYTSLVRQLNARKQSQDPEDSGVKDISDAYFDRWETTFEPAAGLTRDPVTRQLTLTPGAQPLITVGEAAILNQAVKSEMNTVANTAATQNMDKSQQERDRAVRAALQAWWQDNVIDSGGKYYLGDVTNSGLTYDEKVRKHWADLANNPAGLSDNRSFQRPAVLSELSPRDLTQYVNPGVPASVDTQQRFNPLRQDQVLTLTEVQTYRDMMAQGNVPKELVITAQSLGMSPLALINNQIGAYPQAGLKPLPPVTTPKRTDNKIVSTEQYIGMGLPPNTAKYLSENGVYVTAANFQDMDRNSEQFRILTNPFATPRMLARATKDLKNPYEGVLSLIRSGEGGFDSANRGTAGDTPGGVPGLSNKTLGEWKALQNSGYFALGAYQFIPETLALAAREAGVSENTVMTPDVQGRLAVQLMTGSKRPRLAAYLAGRSNNIDAALDDLALEWASVASASGGSAYAGVGGNAASISRSSARQQLIQLRNTLNS